MTNQVRFWRHTGLGALGALILGAALLSLTLLGSAKPEATAEEGFSRNQVRTVAQIIDRLDQEHYHQLNLNDALSQRFLDNYFTTLDPGHYYLLQTDVDEFAPYGARFDDLLRDGELDIGYRIYQRYRERALQRLDWAEQRLQDPEWTFDFDIDETLIIDREEAHWPADAAAADELWRKRLKLDTLNLVMAGKTQAEAKETLLRRYRNQRQYLERQNREDAFELFVNALTELYDPHTSYLSPATTENFYISMSLSLEGIGAVLQSEDEFTKVVRVIPGGPAENEGSLKPGDRITAVAQGEDGELVDVIGWRLDEVVELIRGPSGSIVRLEIQPPGASVTSRILQLERNRIELEENRASKQILEVSDGKEIHKVGVIKVPSFYMDFDAYSANDPNYTSSTRDVLRLLEELRSENIAGLILDLRGNSGGSLFEATTLTDLFIDPGPVVQIRHADQTISTMHRAKQRAFYRGPLVVMIDRLSASASEIFAGAIQDYGRGLVIGNQSFGKGTVQTLMELREGQIKLTQSKFYRVSGDSTQHRGVIPDLSLPALFNPDVIGESTLDNALPWDTIDPVKHARYYDFSPLLPELTRNHQQRMAADPDFRYLQAELALLRERRERDRVSLNLNTREQERADFEAELLTLENQRRQAKGLPALDALPEDNATLLANNPDAAEVKDGNGEDNNGAGNSTGDNANNGDFILQEAGYLLLDMDTLLQQRREAVTLANF